MKDGEPSSFSVVAPARKARLMLASAMEILQRDLGPNLETREAISEAAQASNSLYRVETEARTPEAAAAGIHAAAERLGRALRALGVRFVSLSPDDLSEIRLLSERSRSSRPG